MSQADWIKATTATTGTGTLTLSGVTGYATVGDWFADGALVGYVLLDSSGLPIERGIGTYTASGTTLARTWVGGTYVSGTLTKDGTTITPATLGGTTTVIITKFAGADAPGLRGFHAISGGVRAVHGCLDGATLAGGAVTANRLYVTPWRHQTARRLKSMKLYSGSPSGNLKFLIYRLGIDGYPTTKLHDSGSIAMGSGFNTYTPASPLWLPPDYYGVGVVIDNGTATFRTVDHQNSKTVASPFGVDSSGYVTLGLYLAITFASPPDPFTAGATALSMSGGPVSPLVLMEYES